MKTFSSFHLQLKKGIPNFALPKGTIPLRNTGVAKLVDVPDLGSGAVRHGGSSPFARTFQLSMSNYQLSVINSINDLKKPF